MSVLINDKETARQFVRINFINDVSSLPDFDLAAARYLIPITGQDLYDDLVANITEAGYADLLKLCRAVIAPLGYMMELATIQTQLTDAGLRSISTEHSQAAHRWEYNEVKNHLEDKGAYAIEALLKYLFELSYALWTDSDEYKDINRLIFKTGIDFQKYFFIRHPHRVFWSLKPQVMEVQDFYINTTIGEEFFLSLKNNATPSAKEKVAIELIKKATAHFTIATAIEKRSVELTENGFSVMLSAGNSDSANAGDAEQRDPQMDLLYKSCTRTGDAYLLQLKEYLDKEAKADVMEGYFSSDYYSAPTTTVSDRNKCRKIFGL
ncbi:MAG: DUF6712 family protein [Chitinophagaceae bacterium]